MSWNKVSYKCTCGVCVECLGEKNRKSIYKAPKGVQEEWFQKKISEEEQLISSGKFIPVTCPKCRRDRLVMQSSLKFGFSCDKCGFKA